jgi:hypothetical protein
MKAVSQKHTNHNNQPKNTTMNKRSGRGEGREVCRDGEIQLFEKRTKPSEEKE